MPVIQLLGSDDDDDDVIMTAGGGGDWRFGTSPRRKRRRQQLETNNKKNYQQPPPPAGRFKTDRDDDGNPIIFAPPPPPPPVLPEHQVLEFFPDADSTFLQNLLKKLVNADDGTPNVALVINYMAEKGYEKSSAIVVTTTNGGGGGTVYNGDGKNHNNCTTLVDFMSTDSFPADDLAYRHQAQSQLEYDFPCLSVHGARAILLSCKNHYAIAHDRIVAALKGTTTTAANNVAGVSLEVARTYRFRYYGACSLAFTCLSWDPEMLIFMFLSL